MAVSKRCPFQTTGEQRGRAGEAFRFGCLLAPCGAFARGGTVTRVSWFSSYGPGFLVFIS